MLNYILFCSPLLLTLVLAVVRGGKDERIGAASFAIAYVATVFADGLTKGRVSQPEWAVAAVDLALAGPLIYLVIFSNRFWPIWALGFHCVTLLTHLAAWVQPEILPKAYAVSIGFWSFPTVGALLFALLMKERFRDSGTSSQASHPEQAR